MPYMFDSKTGEQIWVPDEQVEDGWKTGRFVFPKGTNVSVNVGGAYTTVNESDLQKVFEDGGHYDMLSQRVTRNESTFYGGKNAATFALGAGRGVAGSLSDYAMTLFGADAEELEKYHEYNKGFSIAGQLAGAVAPAFVSGGASLLARGASLATPAGLAIRGGAALGGKAGEFAQVGIDALKGSTAARATGTAAGMAGNPGGQAALARAFAGATEGVADVAIFGAFDVLGEQLLGNPATFAENYVSNVGVPALMAGSIGAVLGGSGVIEGMQKALSGLNQAKTGFKLPKGSKLAEIFEDAADGDPDTLQALGRLKKYAEEGTASDEEIIKMATGLKNPFPKEVKKAANDVLDLTQAMKDIWTGPRANSPAVKKAGWGELIGRPTAAIKDGGLAGSDPLQAMTRSLDQIRPLNDAMGMILRSDEQLYKSAGIPEIHREIRDVQKAVENSIKKSLGLPKKAKIKFDSDLGEYRIYGVGTEVRKSKDVFFGGSTSTLEDPGRSLAGAIDFSRLSPSRKIYKQAKAREPLIDVFTSLDRAKRVVDTKRFKDAIFSIKTQAVEESKKRTYVVLQQEGDSLRKFLTEEGVWGEAATAQREINDAISPMLVQQQKFYRTFGEQVPTGMGDKPVESVILDRRKAEKYVKAELEAVPREENIPMLQVMKSYREATKAYHGAISNRFGGIKVKGKNGRMAPVLTADFDNAVRRFDAADGKFDSKFTHLREAKSARDALFELKDGVEAGSSRDALSALAKRFGPAAIGASAGGLPGSAAGAVIGGTGGWLLGKLAKRSRSPYERITEITRLKSKQLQYKSKYDKLVSKASKRLTQKGEASLLGGKLDNKSWQSRWAPVLSANETRWEARDERKIEQEAIRTMRKWQSDPSSLQGRIMVATSMLGGRAPKVREAMAEQVTRICNYAAGNIPRGIIVTTDPFTGEERISGPDYSFGEFNDMMQTLDVGLEYVAQNFVRGTLTSQMVDAWKINFPEEYTNFCSDLMTKSSPKKRNISYAMKSQFSTLYGVPLEPSLSGANIRMMQSTWEIRDQQQEEQGMGGTSRPAALKSMARNAETQSNRLLGPNSN